MGAYCGEKVKSIIEIYRILNGLGFLPIKFLQNANTLLNFWSLHIIDTIASISKYKN